MTYATLEPMAADSPARPMQDRWNDLAERDAMFYIATRAQPWTRDEFFATGAAVVDDMLAWIGASVPRGRLLEIGCGLGRTAVHFAGRFAQVDAIDIAPAMIEQARALDPPANVRFAVAEGGGLAMFEDASFDVVVSMLVFQHIPQQEVIRRYLAEIARVMRGGGRAVLQFDTRPSSLAVQLCHALPDALLPRTHRRFIRRYRRDALTLRGMMAEARLRIIDERGPTSAEHFFLLERAAAPSRQASAP
jgi:SAM-dependent methyltransferase